MITPVTGSEGGCMVTPVTGSEGGSVVWLIIPMTDSEVQVYDLTLYIEGQSFPY